jgi:hypothetical protein
MEWGVCEVLVCDHLPDQSATMMLGPALEHSLHSHTPPCRCASLVLVQVVIPNDNKVYNAPGHSKYSIIYLNLMPHITHISGSRRCMHCAAASPHLPLRFDSPNSITKVTSAFFEVNLRNLK